jgi:hypothetical protein
MIKKKFWMGIVIGGMLMAVAACRCQEPTSDSIVGIWEEDRGTASSVPCASFEFFADGHFEAYNVPSGYFITFPDLTINSVTGLWKLAPSSKDLLAPRNIELTFNDSDEAHGFHSTFFTPGAWQGDVIYAGDFDNPIPFVKKNEAECR